MGHTKDMKTKKTFFLSFFIIAAFHGSILGQTVDKDSIPKETSPGTGSFNIRMSTLGIVASLTSISYGSLKQGNHQLRDIDLAVRQEFALEHPHPKFRADDYLQFAPAGTVLLLGATGVKGQNSLQDQAGLYILSNLFLNATCQSIKRIAKVTRPNGTSNAFPSGHTAEAFASAEFLSIEYRRQSIAFPVAGYISAFAVGYLRMYNNKHSRPMHPETQ